MYTYMLLVFYFLRKCRLSLLGVGFTIYIYFFLSYKKTVWLLRFSLPPLLFLLSALSPGREVACTQIQHVYFIFLLFFLPKTHSTAKWTLFVGFCWTKNVFYRHGERRRCTCQNLFASVRVFFSSLMCIYGLFPSDVMLLLGVSVGITGFFPFFF